MTNNHWDAQRAEIATWLSGWLGMAKKWTDKILDSDHDVDKNKIINVLTEWIAYLEELKIKIIKMPSNSRPESSISVASSESYEKKFNR